MDNVITEETIKTKLGINNWRELSKDKVIELVNIFENSPALDKDVYLKILGNVPEVMSAFKEITTIFKDSISESSKASQQTKNYYINLSNRLLDLLDKNDLTPDEKDRVFCLISDINSYIKNLDFEEKQLYRDIWDKIGKIGVLVLAIVGGVLGVKLKNKK
ncbi:hypothetical protein [Clostridium folliculivorans]|uniref:hypothetical protein n=1 Tax=Clostridium folliculivorans TaxID=2886038 RepID=UPI0021C3A55B|nr:hypothetical protein [Clostridium folliculivorans]GKU29273.1 hypothetical protein CFB3_13790 [Clostridium folliculivorans]